MDQTEHPDSLREAVIDAVAAEVQQAPPPLVVRQHLAIMEAAQWLRAGAPGRALEALEKEIHGS